MAFFDFQRTGDRIMKTGKAKNRAANQVQNIRHKKDLTKM